MLIVDDSPMDLRITGSFVEKHLGWDCRYASDGRDALNRLSEQLPDLVLTDLQMPNMNGFELVDAVRGTYPQLPVVLMTAYGSEKIALEALRLGAASYIRKHKLEKDLPVTLEQVVETADRQRRLQRLEERLTFAEFHFALENDPALVPVLVGRLNDHLAVMRLTGRDGGVRVSAALGEALLNALYHGNLEVSSEVKLSGDDEFYQLVRERRSSPPYEDRRIHVTAKLTPDEAVFVIRDEGPGFHVGALPDPTDPENLLKPSGRGVLLMRIFMDDVIYNERGNEVTLIKRRPIESDTEAADG